MTVVETAKDAATLTLTVTCEFDADPARVWNVWADPRKIERWWGPPTFPATFTRHDFTVGGESRYYMTGPEGQRHYGWWRFDGLDEPARIDFANGLSGEDGEPVPGVAPMPTYVTFESTGTGTTMTAVTHFADTTQMETMVEMGMPEGMSGAMSQIDGLLAAASV